MRPTLPPPSSARTSPIGQTVSLLAAGPQPVSPAAYAFLQRYIYAESGIVLDADKQYLLESRLQPILREQGIESLDALIAKLAARSSPTLARLVVEAMTTNETLFFRDPPTFEALRSEVLPALFARAGGTRKVRIWSAAASSGQEAYSLALLLLEMGHSGDEFEIVGTDLSTQVLERAREGRYVPFEVRRGLPPAYLQKYFSGSGSDWELHAEVRKLVRFEQRDLRRDFVSLGKFDLVLCRNVLIYFDATTKGKIIEAMRERLLPGGFLLLGCAETVINVHDGFRRTMIGQSAFYSLSA